MVDIFSMRIVSRLQGSVSLEDAQSRAREVLEEFRKEVVSDADELAQKVVRHVAANKVLLRALHIVKASSGSVEERYASQLEEANQRARTAEHTVELLRWHLQHGSSSAGLFNSGMGGFPPDVF